MKVLIPDKNPVYPVINCKMEFPCNKCVSICPTKSILNNLPSIPYFTGSCIYCKRCVSICPDKYIKLIHHRKGNFNQLEIAKVNKEEFKNNQNVKFKINNITVKGKVTSLKDTLGKNKIVTILLDLNLNNLNKNDREIFYLGDIF